MIQGAELLSIRVRFGVGFVDWASFMLEGAVMPTTIHPCRVRPKFVLMVFKPVLSEMPGNNTAELSGLETTGLRLLAH
jgi:hypothetical protein